VTAEPRRDRTGPELLLVVLGGTAGTAARAALGTVVPEAAGVPVGILAINLVGAFVLGALLEALVRRGPDTGRRRGARLLLGTGVLGGFTTYSALAAGTATLLQDGRAAVGLGYALATVVLGGVATALGVLLGRALPGPRGGRA
jgi:fluoride exporter